MARTATPSRRPTAARSAPDRAAVFDRSAIVPLACLAGLVVVAVLSLGLIRGTPEAGAPRPSASGSAAGFAPVPAPTPNRSVIITPPPERGLEIRGTIVFANGGNIWQATGRSIKRLTDTGADSSPTWSPDGRTIYFIETRPIRARAPYEGRDSTYTLYRPVLMKMAVDGSRREVVKDSLVQLGGGPQRRYFTWLLQPDVSPDGATIALVSDAPEPFTRDVTLSLMPAAGGRVENLDLPAAPGLGHNDPAWSPRGDRIAFTQNGREDATGTPRIAVYDVASRRMRLLSPPGYAQPAWSPDGTHIAAVKTSSNGRDVVVLRARDGVEVARLTRDGGSFAPAWSPDGKQIAYLRLEGQSIDLRILTLADGGAFAVAKDRAVTTNN